MLYANSKIRIRNFKKILLILWVVFVMLFLRATHRRRFLAKIIIEGWDQNTPRNTSLYVLPGQQTTIHLPNEFCAETFFLMVVVASAPQNIRKRQAIRETWGSQKNMSNFNVDIYFLIGLPSNADLQGQIVQESSTYDDLIQERFIDDYYNLTLKSVMMLKLVESHCMDKIKYLLKTDDDMYVNIESLVSVLREKNRRDLLMGYRYVRPHPIRDEFSKWYTPYYLYSKKYFPSFLSGTGYVMSVDVVPKLYSASLHIPLLHLEDVYITGILSREVYIEVKHNENFSKHKTAFHPCSFRTTITSHGYSEIEIRELHSQILKTNSKSCDKQSWYWFWIS